MNREIEKLKLIKEKLVEKCSAVIDDKPFKCSKADGEHCSVYAFPAAKWRIGDCPMASLELRTTFEEKPKDKVRVGQQKQKKKK